MDFEPIKDKEMVLTVRNIKVGTSKGKSEEELKDLFEQYGEVKECCLVEPISGEVCVHSGLNLS